MKKPPARYAGGFFAHSKYAFEVLNACNEEKDSEQQ